MNKKNQDTIVALATAPQLSAIGVIRLSGARAFSIVTKIFPSKKLDQTASHTIHYGKIVDDGETIDQVVISVFRNPHSYTGEDIVEISAHGSPFILNRIIELLIKHGARHATAGEFTMRAFLNGKMDLSQAEAVADLIASEAKLSQQIAIKQLKGGVKNQINDLRQQLLHFASMLELELDFGEEDVEFADRTQLRDLIKNTLDHIQKLQSSFQLGNAIHEGITTVIAGRPNAGKSTLLNALLDDERAIVSDIAGTTRDTIEEKLIIDGLVFRIIDTAGIRDATDQIEKQGVKRTLDKIKESSVLIYVADIIELSTDEINSDLQKLKNGNIQLILVLNKMDRNPYIDYKTYASDIISTNAIIPCSAKNKMNIDHLKNTLVSLIKKDQLIEDNIIITNARHYHSFVATSTALESALQGIDSNLQTDFLSQHIRTALYHLSEITGTITNDEILANIFSKFCIGK